MNKLNRSVALLMVFCLSLLVCLPGVPVLSAQLNRLPVGETVRTLTHDARQRNYVLYVPAAIDWNQPVPLLFVFHGAGGSGMRISQMSAFNAIADENGFIVAYPNGTGPLGDGKDQTWNAGNCCGYAKQHDIDDVGFVRAIVADLQASVQLDTQRIYAAGMSNGGMMSYRLACEAADLFAAVAPVAGALTFSPCNPSQPIALLAFHGTKDGAIAYGAALDSVKTWASLSECDPEPERDTFEDIHHDVWMGCAPSSEVEMYSIVDGDHSWPGDARLPPGTDTISASPLIWEFFAAHPRATLLKTTLTYLPLVLAMAGDAP